PPPEGHFGSVMMRERALVAGGSYSLQSEIGKGTTITANFPRVWVEEGSELEAEATENGDDAGNRPSSAPPVGTREVPTRTGPADDRNGATEAPVADPRPAGRDGPHPAPKDAQAPESEEPA